MLIIKLFIRIKTFEMSDLINSHNVDSASRVIERKKIIAITKLIAMA